MPYGYEIDGEVADVDKAIAADIRIVFDVYVRYQGSPGLVVSTLEDLGVLSPAGKGWHRDTLLKIIRTSAYGGHHHRWPAIVNRQLGVKARRIAAQDKRKSNKVPTPRARA